MNNLVFRFYLTVTLCWHGSIAERFGGYFYDKPQGPPFDESPSIIQIVNSNPVFPLPQQLPTSQAFGNFQQQPSGPEALTTAAVEIVPSKLVYEDLSSQQQQQQQNVPNFENRGNIVQQPQQVYGGPVTGNFQPIVFNIQDGSEQQNSIQKPCGQEPIVAQFSPQLVDFASGGPLTRQITTCGPGNNNCKTITLQSDLNRQLGVLQQQGNTNYGVNVQQRYQQFNQVEPRTANVGIYSYAPSSDLVRPPNRRLIPYNEIEQNDSYN